MKKVAALAFGAVAIISALGAFGCAAVAVWATGALAGNLAETAILLGFLAGVSAFSATMLATAP